MAINAHQCHTPAALSKAYLEKSDHMPFLDHQSMPKYPCILPGLLRSENLLCGAETWTKITLAFFQLCFFGILFQGS